MNSKYGGVSNRVNQGSSLILFCYSRVIASLAKSRLVLIKNAYQSKTRWRPLKSGAETSLKTKTNQTDCH